MTAFSTMLGIILLLAGLGMLVGGALRRGRSLFIISLGVGLAVIALLILENVLEV